MAYFFCSGIWDIGVVHITNKYFHLFQFLGIFIYLRFILRGCRYLDYMA
jgi:hypothetical protein